MFVYSKKLQYPVKIDKPNPRYNHQESNARVLSEAGGAVLLLEKECTPEVLYRQVTELLADADRRAKMGNILRGLVKTDSAERICQIVEELIKR